MASKVSQAPAVSQLPDNPLVLIKYDPENALAILAINTTKTLAQLNGAKITSVKQLEAGSEILEDARARSEEVETFINTLREKVQAAAMRFRDFQGFEDFEVTLTIRKWGLRQLLNDGIARLRGARAQFLAADAERIRRENLAKQAEQDRINKEAADKAAAAAKKQGADRQTVADIKQAVLSTPAPIVTSKAAETAQAVGASVRYAYYAKITDLRKFIGFCYNNEIMLNTLKAATEDIESTFRKMASDQKEAFQYPGITFDKRPVDVGRRS
jgi:hypothetical protein